MAHKSWLKQFACVLCLSLAVSAHAAPKKKKKTAPPVEPDHVENAVPTEETAPPPSGVTPVADESSSSAPPAHKFFAQLLLGGSFTHRDQTTQNVIHQVSSIKGVSHFPITAEVAGYGNFINDLTLIGIMINTIQNHWSVSGDSVTLSEFMLGLSVKQYFMHANDGPFVRADGGMGFLNASNSVGDSTSSKIGWAFGASVGYTMNFHWNVNPELAVGYTYRSNARTGLERFHDGALQILGGISFGF